ncbi:hypothetical protein BKA70DRAFT_1427661 [Coprinopsis sp. MPI-PUGE-AT-0042]|nr:hypothetical protein BKA70DRAFT_1427661 [Coprinopsis sp. MPI-PUGE-AT-0042]
MPATRPQAPVTRRRGRVVRRVHRRVPRTPDNTSEDSSTESSIPTSLPQSSSQPEAPAATQPPAATQVPPHPTSTSQTSTSTPSSSQGSTGTSTESEEEDDPNERYMWVYRSPITLAISFHRPCFDEELRADETLFRTTEDMARFEFTCTSIARQSRILADSYGLRLLFTNHPDYDMEFWDSD